MDLTRLSYFVAVCDAGTFTLAARRLGIAQPSLSQQIRKLEKELRKPLLDRLPRRVILTAHGRELLDRARLLLRQFDELRLVMQDSSPAPSGTLSLGMIPTIAPYLAPGLLRSYCQMHKGVNIVIHEDVTAGLMRGLDEGFIDVAIVSSVNTPPASVYIETIFHEPLLAVMNRKHPHALRKNVTLGDLHSDKLLLLHDMHCLSKQVAELCFMSGSPRQIVMRGESLTTIGRLIDVGMGVSVVPEMMATQDKSKSRVYRRFDVKITRPIAVAVNQLRYRSAAARAFIQLLRKLHEG